MLIRLVNEADASSLRRNCFTADTAEQTASAVERAIEEQERGDSVMLVAVGDDREITGTCTVARLQHRLCRHRADIGGFVIAPASQGTGLARRLLQAAISHAQGWGCSILEVSCRGGTHAEDAYVGLGFRRWGTLPGGFHDVDGTTYAEVRLWMPL